MVHGEQLGGSADSCGIGVCFGGGPRFFHLKSFFGLLPVACTDTLFSGASGPPSASPAQFAAPACWGLSLLLPHPLPRAPAVGAADLRLHHCPAADRAAVGGSPLQALGSGTVPAMIPSVNPSDVFWLSLSHAVRQSQDGPRDRRVQQPSIHSQPFLDFGPSTLQFPFDTGGIPSSQPIQSARHRAPSALLLTAANAVS